MKAAARGNAPRWSIARLFGKKGFGDLAFTPFTGARTFMVAPGSPVWMDRDYARFALEAYVRNVIAHRCIGMIAQGAAGVRLKLFSTSNRGLRKELKQHPLLELLHQPNPAQAHAAFMEAVYQYRLIAGNAFIQAVGPSTTPPQEMHVLRPDRMVIIAGKNAQPAAYRYTVNGQAQDFPINPVTWASRVLHLKTFHPLNDWYGLSPVEAVAYSIDQHNQAGAWNQALLQNGARPSGALVVKGADGQGGTLSEDQYYRLKAQIDEQFAGPVNAGRPMLLEGGLDWKELSLSPKDMDFIQCKNASARDIALGFGVPPQMLGIPGDNTYSNLQEARLALWEQTILPITRSTLHAMSQWLSPMFGGGLELVTDLGSIEALASRNQVVWDRVNTATFLTPDEKRAAIGYPPLGGMASQLAPAAPPRKYSPDQPRDYHGRWTNEGDGDTQVAQEELLPQAIKPPLDDFPQDITRPPGPEYIWKGDGLPGSKEGSWYNPQTGEQIYNDLNHGEPQGPHLDYTAPDGRQWRWYPDGRMELKPSIIIGRETA